MREVRTKGNVIVNRIKVGDVHYEYEWGLCTCSKVITLPKRDDDGLWMWWSVLMEKYDPSVCYPLILASNIDARYLENVWGLIHYGVHEDYPHYSCKLYDYEAYEPFE